MFSPILLTLIYVCGALSATLGPCKKADQECISNALGRAFPAMIRGVPSRGVNNSDPIFQKVIDADIPPFKCKLTDTSTSGFSKCVLKNDKLNLDALKFNFELECPSFSMHGNYEMGGKLLIMPVEGKGTYDIVSTEYWAGVETNLHKYKYKGKTYLKITDFKLNLKALGPIKFNFTNLFNGRQDLSDAVHNFVHENWKGVASLTDKPIFTKNFQYVTKNFNRYLKFEPLEEVIVDF